jgi:CRP-like cAMP-binding protein
MGEAETRQLSASLRKVDFFANLSVAEIDSIFECVHLYEYDEGEVIFKQGSAASALYIVYQGELSVVKKKGFFSSPKEIGRLKDGNFFGEMALLSRAPRSATVTAARSSKIFVLLRADFEMIKSQNPVFEKEMSKIASRRKFENTQG